MRLLTFHRILIATMVAFLGWFGWLQAARWQAQGGRVALLLVVASGAAAAGLTWYLTHLKRYVRIDESDPTRERP